MFNSKACQETIKPGFSRLFIKTGSPFSRLHHSRGAEVRPDPSSGQGDVQRDRRDDQDRRRQRGREDQLPGQIFQMGMIMVKPGACTIKL